MKALLHHIIILTLVGIAISSGGFLYIGWRDEVPALIYWLNGAGFENIIHGIRLYTSSITIILPDWVIYSLPQGLWAFALGTMISFIWSGQKSFISYLWYCTALMIPILWEALQFFQIIAGTFCKIDLGLGVVGVLCGFMIIHFKIIKL